MKKVLIFFVVSFLIVGSVVSQGANDLTGKKKVGFYLGYTKGYGDLFGRFDKTPILYDEFKTDLSFGLQFYYGVSSNMMIGIDAYVQNYSSRSVSSDTSWFLIPIPPYDITSYRTKTSYLATILFAPFNTAQKGSFFIAAGIGSYSLGNSDAIDFGSKLGYNLGVMWQKKINRKYDFYIMPRMHFIKEIKTVKMLQIAAGISFPIGSK